MTSAAVFIVVAILVMAALLLRKRRGVVGPEWRIGYSPGMPNTPVMQGSGWYFDFPTWYLAYGWRDLLILRWNTLRRWSKRDSLLCRKVQVAGPSRPQRLRLGVRRGAVAGRRGATRLPEWVRTLETTSCARGPGRPFY